jgi:hypothetical protein
MMSSPVTTFTPAVMTMVATAGSVLIVVVTVELRTARAVARDG